MEPGEGKVDKALRQWSVERIGMHMEQVQPDQVPEGFGQRAGQSVVMQIQNLQVGEAAQFRWDRAAELVIEKVKAPELREIA